MHRCPTAVVADGIDEFFIRRSHLETRHDVDFHDVGKDGGNDCVGQRGLATEINGHRSRHLAFLFPSGEGDDGAVDGCSAKCARYRLETTGKFLVVGRRRFVAVSVEHSVFERFLERDLESVGRGQRDAIVRLAPREFHIVAGSQVGELRGVGRRVQHKLIGHIAEVEYGIVVAVGVARCHQQCAQGEEQATQKIFSFHIHLVF